MDRPPRYRSTPGLPCCTAAPLAFFDRQHVVGKQLREDGNSGKHGLSELFPAAGDLPTVKVEPHSGLRVNSIPDSVSDWTSRSSPLCNTVRH